MSAQAGRKFVVACGPEGKGYRSQPMTRNGAERHLAAIEQLGQCCDTHTVIDVGTNLAAVGVDATTL